MPSNDSGKRNLLQRGKSALQGLRKLRSLVQSGEASQKDILAFSVQVLYGKISRGTFPADALVKSESGKRYYIKRSALLAADI